MTEGSRAENLLDNRPEVESSLEDVLTVDEEHETWTFDDVPLDSGLFGQLVSEGIVEKDDGEYRLANPNDVRQALGHQPSTSESSGSVERPSIEETSFSLPTIDGRAAAMLAGMLALVVVVRSYVFGSVFRSDAVVLASNDPYYYLYWVEQSLADGGVGALPFGEVPRGIARGEPFLVATLTWVSGLAGGVDAAGAVLAVYPVVAAVVVGFLLYLLALRVTGDRRVGLAAVAMLAVTPANAFRTALGFADHHAFDFVWLVLTALTLAVLLVDEEPGAVSERGLDGILGRGVATLGLAIGVAGQVLAWDNGPLLVVPVVLVVAARVLLAVEKGQSPVRVMSWLLGGLGVAAVFAYAVHSQFGWHTQTVALTPALVFAGSVGIVAVAELVARLNRSARELAVLEVLTGIVLVVAFRALVPEYWTELLAGIDRILTPQAIAEVQPLFSGGSLGFLLLFGFILFVALGVMTWTSVLATRGQDRWVVPCVYGWYFFGLALFQVRFAGELSPFTALFAGWGLVWLAEKVDLARPLSGERSFTEWVPTGIDRSTVASIFLLFMLIAGLSVVQSGLKINQITTNEASYETAAWLSDYAEERGWDRYEESYVLTSWDENRMYNYFVNGQSRSYGYARSTYSEFLRSNEPSETNSQLAGRVRFVVTEDIGSSSQESMQMRLHEHFGSRNGEVAGLGGFQAVYASASGNRKAFVRVPGARLNGSVASNSSVSVRTNVSIPGASFTYERQATVQSGTYSVRVAYPGIYEVRAGDDSWSVEVSQADVLNGTVVSSGVQGAS